MLTAFVLYIWNVICSVCLVVETNIYTSTDKKCECFVPKGHTSVAVTFNQYTCRLKEKNCWKFNICGLRSCCGRFCGLNLPQLSCWEAVLSSTTLFISGLVLLGYFLMLHQLLFCIIVTLYETWQSVTALVLELIWRDLGTPYGNFSHFIIILNRAVFIYYMLLYQQNCT